jgi:hypothetical protein
MRTRDGDIRFYDPKGKQIHNRPVESPSGSAEQLFAENAVRGLSIGPDTARPPYWFGERLDLSLAVGSLLDLDASAAPVPSFLGFERPRGDASPASSRDVSLN